ncbi:MAG: hypothetical protein ABMA13_00840 [Chthoniobacteraceae bacterium]
MDHEYVDSIESFVLGLVLRPFTSALKSWAKDTWKELTSGNETPKSQEQWQLEQQLRDALARAAEIQARYTRHKLVVGGESLAIVAACLVGFYVHDGYAEKPQIDAALDATASANPIAPQTESESQEPTASSLVAKTTPQPQSERPAEQPSTLSVPEATMAPRTPKFATVEDAQKAAVLLYPDLGIKGSPLNTEFIARYRILKQKQPDYFNDTAWPVLLVEELIRTKDSK